MPPARRRGLSPDELPRFSGTELLAMSEADLNRLSRAVLSPTRMAQARTEILRRQGALAVDAPRSSTATAGRSSGS